MISDAILNKEPLGKTHNFFISTLEKYMYIYPEQIDAFAGKYASETHKKVLRTLCVGNPRTFNPVTIADNATILNRLTEEQAKVLTLEDAKELGIIC